MTWHPGEELLFQQPDTATGLAYHCYFELGDDQTLTGYTWTITPEKPDQFTITSAADGVRLVSDSLAGLFVPEFIDYLDADQVVRVSDWPELPTGKELIEFRPSSTSQREYVLTVTVEYTETDPTTAAETEVTASQSWRCVVLHDYSSGRDKLLEYMNASSH
ncbi:TPA: hypothetical protein ACOJQP_005203 [Vibrio harveyi]|uniref:hypothetical protein n=1 Tax=Vibrio harveyi TaxID=669 RepID=UPI00390B7D36